MLSALLFDFGDTLLSTRLDWARIQPAMLRGLEVSLEPHWPDLDFNRLKRDFLFLRAQGKKLAEQTLREIPAMESLRQALALQGKPDAPPETLQLGVDAFFAPEEAAYPIITGIPEALARIQAMGIRLAVVSNATCGRLIRRALERRMLLPFLEEVVVSADVGVCKPDPGLLLRALQALSITADQAAMVGDRLPTDIEGARRMKMRSVLADFLGDKTPVPPGGPQPDAIVHHPRELVSVVNAWMK